MSWLPDSVQDRLILVLAHFLWQGLAIAGLLALLVSAFRLHRPASRYAVSLASFVLMAACPLATWFVLPVTSELTQSEVTLRSESVVIEEPESRGAAFPEPALMVPVENPFPIDVPGEPLPEMNSGRFEAPPLMNEAPAMPPEPRTWDDVFRDAEPYVVGAWLLGVMLLSLRLLLGAIGIYRWRRNGAPLTDELSDMVRRLSDALRMTTPIVRISQQVSEAVAVGLLRPMILLPAAWLTELPPDMLEAVLAHELAHLRRLDLWVNLFQRVVETLLFYHPVVWWLSRRLRVERELCCDTLAVRATQDPLRYAETLEHVARLNRATQTARLAVAFNTRDGSLSRRIRYLLEPVAPRASASSWFAGCVTLALVLAIPISAFVSLHQSDSAAATETTETTDSSEADPDGDQSEGAETVSVTDAAPTQPAPADPAINDRQLNAPVIDWPQWGRTAERNNVANTRVPVAWNVEKQAEGKTASNISWTAKLGTQTFASPVVVDGKIFIGTNNGNSLDPRHPKEKDLACLLCFQEATGQLLWQYVSEKLPAGRVHDWPQIGLCSTACVKSDRVWVVTNRCEVVCLDANGFRDNENDGPFLNEPTQTELDADVIWKFDMFGKLGVRPLHQSVSSITEVDGVLLLNTSNGPDESHQKVTAPEAPNFLALDAATGRVLWTDNSAGESIVVGGSTCSCSGTSPAVATIGGVRQAIFNGREGWVYGYDFEDLRRGKTTLLWQFDCNPKTSKYFLGGQSRRQTLVSSPVIWNERVYVATGRNPEQGEGQADLWCIDPTKRGDISGELVFNKSFENGEKPIPHKPLCACDVDKGDFTRPNPNNGAVWHYSTQDRNGDGKIGFEETFHCSLGNPVIHNGLLFVADFSGLLHCLDAKASANGELKVHWTHDLMAACWGTPLIADGKVYVCDEDGDVEVFEASVEKKLLAENHLNQSIYATPCAVRGTLFLVTKDRLVAINDGTQTPAIRAKIINVDKAKGTVWISVGTDDGVKPRMRFEVREPKPETNPEAAPRVKGTLEVVRVLNPDTSEARIVNADKDNGPAKGDDILLLNAKVDEAPNTESQWGPATNGLRARVVPVSAEMKEDGVDLAQRVSEFESLDDVGLAVEIENVSDKAVSLRELRYGSSYGDSSGKLAVDWFGQFLFSIDYFDSESKLVERPELIPVGREIGILDGALTSTLEPKQTIKMLLRPNRWISALSQQPLVGKQRAVVRYRGMADGKAGEVVTAAVEFTVKKRGHRPSGGVARSEHSKGVGNVAGNDSTTPFAKPQGVPPGPMFDDPQNDPELEPDITKQLAWGEPVNGLRAALDVIPEGHFKALSHGTKPKLKLLVQNVSDKPVTLATLMWLSELPVKAKNSKDDDVEMQNSWYSGITPVVRVVLKPQQLVTFDAGNVGLAIAKARAEKFEHVTHRKLVAPRGKYSLQATERFGTNFRLEDGKGNVLVPADGDFKGDLTTGAIHIDIENEVIECEIVDAVTGKPVEGTTASFLIIKPKTATSEEATVANLIWGPKSPSKIYFTIPQFPEDIAQRPDRDELEIRFGVGNHPGYEDFSPTERIPLKQFFHEGPAAAREVLSKIKLTPKKKAAEASTSTATPSARLNVEYEMPGAEAETRIHVERLDPEFQARHGRRDEYGQEEYGGVRFSRLKNGESLTISDLSAGTYQLARYRLLDIVREGTGKAQKSVYLDRQWIELTEREAKTVRVSRPEGHSLSGRVVIPANMQVNTLAVHVCNDKVRGCGTLNHQDVVQFDALNANADGTFKTEALPPGRYKVVVEGYANHSLALSGIIAPSWEGMTEVTVPESSAPATIDVTLRELDRDAWLKDQTTADAEHSSHPGHRAIDNAVRRVAIQDVVKGVDFSKVKVLDHEVALRQTPELHVPNPQNPGSWVRPKNVFPMPLGEHTWLKYPAGSGHFYIEHRPDGSPESEQLHGPIDGDPFDVLKLDDFFIDKLNSDGGFGDPSYRLRLMFRTGEPMLSRRAWQFIAPILARKFVKRDEPDLFSRLELLRIAREGLRDEVAKSKSPEMIELAAQMTSVIRAAEESVDAINDSVPDATYQSVSDLQAIIQAKLPDALWGQPVSGLRLGLVPSNSMATGGTSDWSNLPADASLPTKVTATPGEPMHYRLMVENVTDHEIKLSGYVIGEEMARSVEIQDRNAKPVMINSYHTSIPHFISHWRLKPGERKLLPMPAIYFHSESPQPNHAGLGYHVTVPDGQYSLRCSFHFGDLDNERHRHAPGKSEWIGMLTTGTQTITVGDGDDKAPLVPAQRGDEATTANRQRDLSLADLVRVFNDESQRLGRGLNQAALTEEEVVAVIRQDKWPRQEPPLNEQETAAFKAVAESKRLPKGSRLQVHTEDHTETFLLKQLWQVRLMLPAIGHDGLVGLTIRDTVVSEEKVDPKQVAWGKPDVDGLSLGAYLSPRKAQYAIGERVRLRLFVRNDGKQPLKDLTFFNSSHPMPDDFSVADETGAKVAMRIGHEDWNGPWVSGATQSSLAVGAVHALFVPYEILIGGDGSQNELIGRVIDAKPGQKLQLKVREHNGSERERQQGEPEPESGSISFTVAEGSLDPAAAYLNSDGTTKPATTSARPQAESGNEKVSEGLDFLKPYPRLHALSFEMTEPQFLEIVKQQELKTRRSGEGKSFSYVLGLGDGHSLVVMFGNNGEKCSGIQRVRGEDDEVARPESSKGVGEKETSEVEVAIARKTVEPLKFNLDLMLESNRKVRGSIPRVEVERARLNYELALLDVQKAERRAKGEDTADLDVQSLRKQRDAVKAEYDQMLDSNRKVPGSLPQTELDRSRLAWERIAAELKRAEARAEQKARAGRDNSGGPPELRVLKKPAVLLPDHWIMQAVGFENDRYELVTASNQSFITIRRWDLAGMKLLSEIKLQADQHGRRYREGTLMFSGDQKRVIAATDEYVGIWDAVTGKLLKQLPFKTKEGIYECVIDKLDATPDLSVIVGHRALPGRLTLSYDAYVFVWDGVSGNVMPNVIDKGATNLIAMDLSTDGKRLVTTNGGGAKIWDTSSGKLLRSISNDEREGEAPAEPRTDGKPGATGVPPSQSHVWSVQFSPDGQQLALGDVLGVKLLDVTSGKLLRQLEGPYRYSSSSSPGLVFSKDGERLARLGTQEPVELEMKDFPPDYRPDKDSKTKHRYVVPIWSTRTGAREFELHTEANDAAFSDDGQCLAVVFSDMQQALSVWQLNDDDADDIKTTGPGPHSRVDRVEENGHYVGAKAAEYIEQFQPTWGEAKLGLQYGLALTKQGAQFKAGDRVPLVAFFRNVSDQPIKFDTAPDFFGNVPRVLNSKGESIALENIPLLGSIPHYHETLAPGEALGPFYLSIGLGENPRPGRQHWHPLLKSPVTGNYKLTHTVSVNVPGTNNGAAAKTDELTSNVIEFKIVESIQATTSTDSPSTPERDVEPAAVQPNEPANQNKAQSIPPLLEFRVAAQPANSEFEPRIPADFEKREYSGNSVIGRMIARDRGFVWVPVAEGTETIPKLPVERPQVAMAREALLADTPEHALPFNGKWSIEDCRAVRDPNGGGQFMIELKLNEAGGEALRSLTKSHLNQTLAIVVHNRIIAAPTIRSEIGRNIAITGNFNREQAEKFAAALQPAAVQFPEPSTAAEPIDPNGEIHGVLLGRDDQPVAGATVACGAVINDSLKGGGASAVTDAAGRYRLKVPSPGIYNVWLKTHDDPFWTAAADDGLFVDGGEVTTSKMQLIRGTMIAGSLVDTDGKPLSGLSIYCYSLARPQSGATVQSVRTDDKGEFKFWLVPGRAYVYAANQERGRAEAIINVPRNGHPEPVEPLKLVLRNDDVKFGSDEWLKQSSPGTQIVRHENARNVKGTVVDSDDQPIVGAKVFRYDGPIVTTNDKGEFEVSADKGTQFILFACGPHTERPASRTPASGPGVTSPEGPSGSAAYRVWFGTPTAGDVLKIVLEPKSDTTLATNTLERDMSSIPLRVRLLGASMDEPLVGVQIELMLGYGSEQKTFGPFTTDDTGTIRATLARGTYRLRLTSMEELPYLPVDAAWNRMTRGPRPSLTFAVGKDGLTKWIPERHVTDGVEAGPDQLPRVTFTLLPATELILRAVDVETGKGLPGVEFFAENAVGEEWAHEIDGQNIGWKKQKDERSPAESNVTDKDGNFRRLVSANAGFMYGVTKPPTGYEAVQPGKEIDLPIVYGQLRAAHTFQFRRIQKQSAESKLKQGDSM